jgi:hypothetical protein
MKATPGAVQRRDTVFRDLQGTFRPREPRGHLMGLIAPVCLRIHGAVPPAMWDRDQTGFQVLYIGLAAIAQHLIQLMP